MWLWKIFVDAANIATGVAALITLWLLDRQNRYLWRQMEIPDPDVSAEVVLNEAWDADGWHAVAVTVQNHANVPLHLFRIEMAQPKGFALFRRHGGRIENDLGQIATDSGPPHFPGRTALPCDETLGPPNAGPGAPPDMQRVEILLRGDRAGRPLPNLRLHLRFKNSAQKTMVLEAKIWAGA